jgi:hypothetical protein
MLCYDIVKSKNMNKNIIFTKIYTYFILGDIRVFNHKERFLIFILIKNFESF